MAGLSLSYFSFGYVAWIFFSWFFIYMAQARGVNLKPNAFMSMIPFIANDGLLPRRRMGERSNLYSSGN